MTSRPHRSVEDSIESHRRLRPAAFLVAALVALGTGAEGGRLLAQEQDQELAAAGVRKFRKEQKRPIELGTSGGNANAVFPDDDPAFIVCSSGTLGGLVLKNGVPYILSNNHVIAIENEASKGDPIDQPGLIDSRCESDEENFVGYLTGWKKLKFGGVKKNRSDVAIAEVIPGAVDAQGRMLSIGVPGNSSLEPEVGMPVKKAGRTTGLTRGTITAIDVTGTVSFSAAGAVESVARFVDVFLVESTGNKLFVESGDSGSVVVYDGKTCPEWVGLLFAGSDDGIAVVSPMAAVLKDVKKIKPRGAATLVGCESDPRAVAPAGAPTGLAAKLERSLRRARRVKSRHELRLLDLDGVVGVGLGRARAGNDIVLKVFVEEDHPGIEEAVPPEIEGLRTEIVVSGPFRAL